MFLTADAAHLLAHVGIFGVLLLPPRWWPGRWGDVSASAVLILVGAIAVGITFQSVRALVVGVEHPVAPAVMLLSLVGPGANATAAWLLTAPARRWWSFRAALAPELSDGALTIPRPGGAGAIAALGRAWGSPGLSQAHGMS